MNLSSIIHFSGCLAVTVVTIFLKICLIIAMWVLIIVIVVGIPCVVLYLIYELVRSLISDARYR